MTLSWNEIRSRATAFAKEYKESTGEIQDYADFWTDFFDIFGVRRRSVAGFQRAIQKINGNTGFIDLFWPGVLLVEHKSRGESLDSATLQANDYFLSLAEENRPRFIVVTDFEHLRLYDLEGKNGKAEEHTFRLTELPAHIRLFGFIAGYEVRHYEEENPVNKKAVRVVVQLYRALYQGNYPKEQLARLMVRLVFLYFADDAGIFPKRDIFHDYVAYLTKENGEDLGGHLQAIFQVLNTPEDRRQQALSDDLKDFPYVNGTLFKDPLSLPFFNKEMRQEILNAARFDWGSVSPAIFGSMFQFVMDVEDEDIRHDFGAHYTSEKNILKVIDGLFLDDVRDELEKAGENQSKLNALWNRIVSMRLLDPACGCGNFLVVAYRELRLIELEIIKRLYREELKSGQTPLNLKIDVSSISKLTLEHLSGIEILAFPAEIARLSLWLIDHQMNVILGNLFGEYFAKLPLKEQPFIFHGDALNTDWSRLAPEGASFTYILGNPPFIAKQDQSPEQKTEMQNIFGDLRGAGELDYVTAWYAKAADFIQGTKISSAFVSTNSITQGEQAAILWPLLLGKGININFAHRTFRWSNEAPGRAGVHCVIIGFSLERSEKPKLWDYDDPGGSPHLVQAQNINPYLVDADNLVVLPRRKPIAEVPEARFGSMPNDGGFLLFDDNAEKESLLIEEPAAERFIRPLLSAKEYLNGSTRYCLWLKNATPQELRAMPHVMQRVESVRTYRDQSKREATRRLARKPYLFGEDRQPDTEYVLIPRVSSERRKYVPLSLFGPEYIVGDTCIVVPNVTPYHFGVLQSLMHMTWMRAVCGRLESRYRYSNELVYNNYPWPQSISTEHRHAIEDASNNLLDVRKECRGTLADLYDPNVMPSQLLEAHERLDKAVDAAYGAPRGFASEAERLEFLFVLYEAYIN
ncbi:MAG TPA: DNA methyltransferase [Candidatus Paceibacterota bacterium]|nr:DNA methyltransferase [Candidatus Paceibacterota bacterium]